MWRSWRETIEHTAPAPRLATELRMSPHALPCCRSTAGEKNTWTLSPAHTHTVHTHSTHSTYSYTCPPHSGRWRVHQTLPRFLETRGGDPAPPQTTSPSPSVQSVLTVVADVGEDGGSRCPGGECEARAHRVHLVEGDLHRVALRHLRVADTAGGAAAVQYCGHNVLHTTGGVCDNQNKSFNEENDKQTHRVGCWWEEPD